MSKLHHTKVCLNCQRTLPPTKYRYVQTYPDNLDPKCLSCRASRLKSPSLERVLWGERWLTSLIERASQQFDPMSERLMFEEHLFKLMFKEGYLKEWRPPVWLDLKLYQDDTRKKTT